MSRANSTKFPRRLVKNLSFNPNCGNFFSVQPEPTNAQHAILRECILTNILEQLFETKPALHTLLKHLVAGKRLLLGSIYGV